MQGMPSICRQRARVEGDATSRLTQEEGEEAVSPEEHAAVWKDVALKMRETALNQTDPHRAAAPKSPDSGGAK
jgi:hypothetical protein